jgi:hypothetical protein
MSVIPGDFGKYGLKSFVFGSCQACSRRLWWSFADEHHYGGVSIGRLGRLRVGKLARRLPALRHMTQLQVRLATRSPEAVGPHTWSIPRQRSVVQRPSAFSFEQPQLVAKLAHNFVA